MSCCGVRQSVSVRGERKAGGKSFGKGLLGFSGWSELEWEVGVVGIEVGFEAIDGGGRGDCVGERIP